MRDDDLYGLGLDEAENGVIKWGDHFVYRNGAMAIPPTQQTKMVLVEIPNTGRPVLFTLDLEMIWTNTQMPPVAPFPVGGLNGGAFRVRFGAGNDVREHTFEPGIHSILADSLRVWIVPHMNGAAILEFDYRAHCAIQEGVSPSYTYIA